jgi:hypothetical protein
VAGGFNMLPESHHSVSTSSRSGLLTSGAFSASGAYEPTNIMRRNERGRQRPIGIDMTRFLIHCGHFANLLSGDRSRRSVVHRQEQQELLGLYGRHFRHDSSSFIVQAYQATKHYRTILRQVSHVLLRGSIWLKK